MQAQRLRDPYPEPQSLPIRMHHQPRLAQRAVGVRRGARAKVGVDVGCERGGRRPAAAPVEARHEARLGGVRRQLGRQIVVRRERRPHWQDERRREGAHREAQNDRAEQL